MINSKQKGNTFERKVANILSERFATILDIEQGFRRNPSSGSFFGASNQKRLETHSLEHADFGDILAPAHFRFTIEAKHYKDAPAMAAFVKGQCSLFDGWIAQSEQDALNAGAKAVIIAKFNNVPEIVITDDGEQDFEDRFAIYRDYSFIALTEWLKRPDEYFFEIIQ